MSSGSSKSGSGSGAGRGRRPRSRSTKEQQDLEDDYTSPPPPTIYDSSIAFVLPDPNPLPDPPPVPRAAPPRLVEKSLSFASALKKPGASADKPSVPNNPKASANVPKPRAPANVPDKTHPISSADAPSQGSGGQGGPHIPQSQADPLQSLKDAFTRLLTTKGKKGDGKSYYERRATVMANLTKCGEDTHVLDVDFNDLLDDNEYFQVAIQCSKDLHTGNNWHGWLQPVARDFLNSYFELEEQDKIRLEFRFINEAKSVKPFTEYPTSKLVKVVSTFRQKYEQRRTTYTGRHVYISVLEHALYQHKEGYSWEGLFDSDDIYIISYEDGSYACRIVAEKKQSTDLSDRVADLQRVNTLVTPKYKLNDMYPAYFIALQEDLASLTVRSLSESGILAYLPFHLAFMTPEARRYLLWEIFLFAQSPELDSDVSRDEYELIFLRILSSDWRNPFKTTTDPILQGVYNHDSTGKGKKAKSSKGLGAEKAKFDGTVGGHLAYHKNVVQHAFEHLCGSGDDSELYAAWKIPKVLPHIIRRLFVGKKMKLMKQLGSIWNHYCQLRDVRDEDH